MRSSSATRTWVTTIPLVPGSALRGEIDWLQEQGLIRSAGPFSPESFERIKHSITLADIATLQRRVGLAERALLEARTLVEQVLSNGGLGPANIYTVLARATSLGARVTAALLPHAEGVEAVPILYGHGSVAEHPDPRLTTAVKIAAEALPTPDDSTPWEAILEFRADPDARHRLVALRRWLRTLATGNRSAHEIEDELWYMLGEYESHMRLHRMKYRMGVFEMLITTTAVIAEELAHLRFGKAAQAVFSLRRERVRLLEAELLAPGRDVSFIVEAAARLGPRS